MNNWHKYVADKIYDTELSYKTVPFVYVCLSVCSSAHKNVSPYKTRYR